MKISIVVYAAFLLFPVLCFSQDGNLVNFINDSLDDYIEEGLVEWEIPGLSIGIIKDGELMFCKGYGQKCTSKKSPVDSNTIFMIGSLSKAITSASTVIAAEKDSFLLNDPIIKWIPEFSLKDESDGKGIIIEDILAGRTGLGSHKGDFLFWKTKLNNTELLKILPTLVQETEVRRKFIYNNISYMLLDDILMRSTGKDWKETVNSEFFTPLEMNNSFTSNSEIPQSKRANQASSHIKHDSKIIPIEKENIDNMGPAGSIVSTSSDMSKWIIEFINDQGIFPVSAKKIMRRPYQLRGYRTRKDHRDQLRFLFSGMGWNIYDEFDKLTYVHDGGTDGSKSYLMIIPEEKFGVVVLTNSRSHNFTEALVDELHYALMEQDFQNFSSDYLLEYKNEEREELEMVEEIQLKIKSNSKKIENKMKYLGRYDNPLYGSMSIVESKSGLELILTQHQNDLKGELDYIGENTFWVTMSSPEFSPTKIEFSIVDDNIVGFTYFSDVTGDINYWFEKSD